MPIVLTYDIEGAAPIEHNRLQSMFERFGWQNLGGTAYRYPRLGSEEPVEDWFNHVVPALMLFRAYLVSSGRPLRKFTLDIQSSVGFNPETAFGHGPAAGAALELYPPTNPAFGERNLREWVAAVEYPY